MRQPALRNSFAQVAHRCFVAEEILEAHELRLSTQPRREQVASTCVPGSTLSEANESNSTHRELPQFRHHANGILRAQRNLRLNVDLLVGNQPQPPALRQRHQAERRLHPCERLADALTAAS